MDWISFKLKLTTTLCFSSAAYHSVRENQFGAAAADDDKKTRVAVILKLLSLDNRSPRRARKSLAKN